MERFARAIDVLNAAHDANGQTTINPDLSPETAEEVDSILEKRR
jgi:hypothetical protein